MKYFKKSMAVTLALSMVLAMPGTPASAAAKVQSVSIQKPDTKVLVLKKNAKYQLKTKVLVKGKITKKTTFKSSNSKVVTVSTKGKLTAKKKGTAKITVTSVAKPSKKAVLTVKVGTPVKAVKLSTTKLTGKAGKSANLKVTVSPKNATITDVTFTSSNIKVAKVSSKGKVSFLKKGNANITAKAQDGSGKKAVCKVTITEAEPEVTPSDPTEAPAETTTPANPTEIPTAVPAEPTTTPAEPTTTPAEPTATPAEPTTTPTEPTKAPIDEGDVLIKNGSFNAGFTGYEPYVDGSATAEYTVNSQTEDYAAEYSISNTGDQDWKVQLKQTNVELEQNQWYKLTLQAKSTKDRKFMYAIQRDGSKHNDDWTPYCQATADLTNGWQTFTEEFQMKEPTDKESVLSISMGAVGGTQITEKHLIYIDNIKLEKIEKPEETKAPDTTYIPSYRPNKPATPTIPPAGVNLIKNPNFANGKESWTETIVSPGIATSSYQDNKAVFDITSVGDADWNVQLKQEGIYLEKGSTYKLTLKATSTAARKIKLNMMNPTSYDWYGGSDIDLEANTEKDVTIQFTMDKNTDTAAGLFISMGQMFSDPENKNPIDTAISTITLSDFSLIKVPQENPGEDQKPTPEPSTSSGNLIKNPNFAEEKESWDEEINSPGVATVSYKNNKAVFDITSVGTADWNIKLKQSGITLEKGTSYKLTLKATSTAARKINVGFQGEPANSTNWYGGDGNIELEANTEKSITIEFTMDKDTDSNTNLYVAMGKMDGEDTPTSTITLSDFSLVKVSGGSQGEDQEPNPEPGTSSENLIKNPNFAEGGEGWENTSGDKATVSFSDNKAVYVITNVGDHDYDVQLKQSGISLENGATYKLTLKATSTAARTLNIGLQGDAPAYTWYGGDGTIQLEANTENDITIQFTMNEATDSTAILFVSMGKMGDDTPTSTITLSDFSLVKVS